MCNQAILLLLTPQSVAGTGTESTGPTLPLLGGSAREATSGRTVNYGGVEGVQPEQTYTPYFDHTYAIINLGDATVNYYQTPAWEDGDPDVDKTKIKQPAKNPLYSYSLATP